MPRHCFQNTVSGRHPHKLTPEIVDEQEQAGGTLAHHRLACAESGKASLVLEFVKNVFRIAPLPIELDDLECVSHFRC